MEMDDLQEYEIPKEAIERLKDPELVSQQIKEGKTFQDILGYSQESMEKFYNIAHGLYQKQEYQKAADSFIFLTTLNPYVHNYWLGLGMAEHLAGSYQGALLAYAMAILTDVENPMTHYHSGNCYRALEDHANAIRSFEMAIKCAGNKDEYLTVREQAESARNCLEGTT